MEKMLNTAIAQNNAWFKQWFNSSFYFKLYAQRNDAEAAGFIDALLHKLQPSSGAAMLDLGCGNGRHSKYLAAKDFNVTGIDLAAASIKDAKRFQKAGLQFKRQDMRNAFGVGVFDYVFNFFTSFGYFTDATDDQKVIQNIHQSLKPGGIMVMDYLNSSFAEQKLVRFEQKQMDGVEYMLERWSDEQFIYKKISIQTNNGPLEFTEQVKKFSLHDFKILLSAHNLKLLSVYGDYNLNGFDVAQSPRIILMAQKMNLAS